MEEITFKISNFSPGLAQAVAVEMGWDQDGDQTIEEFFKQVFHDEFVVGVIKPVAVDVMTEDARAALQTALDDVNSELAEVIIDATVEEVPDE